MRLALAPDSLTQRYRAASQGWQRRMSDLGYAAAYRDILDQFTVDGASANAIMDVGCGAGDFAAAYACGRGRIDHLTLVDPSVEMLQIAMARLAARALHLHGRATGIENITVRSVQDLILCAHVLEHTADPILALERLKHHLAPGGRIILVASKPHWCNWLIWLRWRHRSFDPGHLRKMIQAAGLDCRTDSGLSRGPPRRTSHAYCITHPIGELPC